jgi:hypothetical protein
MKGEIKQFQYEFLLGIKASQNISKGTITYKKNGEMMVIICNMQLLKKDNTFI